MFLLLVLLSTIGPVFWQYSYSAITGQFSTAPSAQHPFGTDLIGHDLFAQVMEAEATSVKTAVLVAVIATTIGTVIGAIAGYYGKLAGFMLMRFTDLILAVPLLAVLLVLANKLSKQAGSGSGLPSSSACCCGRTWPGRCAARSCPCGSGSSSRPSTRSEPATGALSSAT